MLFFIFRLTPWRWKHTNKACLRNAHLKGCWRPPYYTPPQAWSGAIGPSDDIHNNKRCLDTAKPSMRRAAELHRLIAAEYNIEFGMLIILTPKLLNQRTLQHNTRQQDCGFSLAVWTLPCNVTKHKFLNNTKKSHVVLITC